MSKKNIKSAICLKQIGSKIEFDLNTIENLELLSISNIPKSVKRSKGNGKLKLLHEFQIEGSKTLMLYGWNDGEAGWENKHELPPPIDNELYFGNLYLIGKNDLENHVNVRLEDYNNLQEKYFEGFEELRSEDSWSSEESLASDDSLHDFIVDG